LWFSLQLTSKNAKDLYDWDLKGNFGELIEAGAQMTRTGRTALKFALDVRKSGTIGTDILVPEKGFAALEALWKARFVEIADAGLAVKGDIVDPGPRMNVIPRSNPTKFLKAVPSLSRSLTMESVSRTIAFARGQPRRASSIFLIWR